MYRFRLLLIIAVLVSAGLACSISTNPAAPATSPTIATGGQPATAQANATSAATQPAAESPTQPPTAGEAGPAQPAGVGQDEPVLITGDIPYTSPFFLNTTSEPFVMLEDEAGFIKRDREFRFALPGQTIGPVQIGADKKLTYSLALPSVPQATQVDVDNDGQQDTGVQVFAVAYWSNTWGDPFLEERDGKGWSSAYTSARTDPENEDEIVGGTLVVWAPDDQQAFPTGFGPDGLLFTSDDPTGPIPAGYTLVDLNQEPFRFYKEPTPQLTLEEGAGAVKDYSSLNYGEAFQAMFDKASQEYPFTQEKNVDWPALAAEFQPRADQVKSPGDYYRLLRDFANRIPDGHIGFTLDQSVFYSDFGGGFGLNVARLSDGRLVASSVLPGKPGEQAGMQPGAEIITWNGQPAAQALAQVTPGFGPYSTDHARLRGQLQFMGRVPPGSSVDITFKNPGDAQPRQATLNAAEEYDSLLKTIPGYIQDELALPIEGFVLDDSGLGYIRINTFSDDYNMMARLWDHYMQSMQDNKVPGLIIDLRANSGGSLGMALDFAGYFFDREIPLYESYYYNENSGEFEKTAYPAVVKPAPLKYDGPIAVLVSADCVSACEGFAYALKQDNRATIIGHEPTAGAFGEVGLGQYKLPGDISGQLPTGRSVTSDGQIVIEGSGVIPDIVVPVTIESAIGQIDAVLQAAIQALR